MTNASAPRAFLTVPLLLVSLLASWGIASAAEPPPPTPQTPVARASEGSAETTPVTYENLYEREQYWPYQIQLTDAWKPEGWGDERFGWGIGVLVRVESSGLLRVDFARFGKHLVPARVTNVLDEANGIRLGRRAKPSPNFELAVGPRLLDPKADPIDFVESERFEDVSAYLVVAADPASEGFAALASKLEPIRGRRGVMLVLFPQGGHDDPTVLDLCKQAGWRDPFLLRSFVRPYTASYLGGDPEIPGMLLNSPDGKVMFEAAWSEGAPVALARRLDRASEAATAKKEIEREPTS